MTLRRDICYAPDGAGGGTPAAGDKATTTPVTGDKATTEPADRGKRVYTEDEVEARLRGQGKALAETQAKLKEFEAKAEAEAKAKMTEAEKWKAERDAIAAERDEARKEIESHRRQQADAAVGQHMVASLGARNAGIVRFLPDAAKATVDGKPTPEAVKAMEAFAKDPANEWLFGEPPAKRLASTDPTRDGTQPKNQDPYAVYGRLDPRSRK